MGMAFPSLGTGRDIWGYTGGFSCEGVLVDADGLGDLLSPIFGDSAKLGVASGCDVRFDVIRAVSDLVSGVLTPSLPWGRGRGLWGRDDASDGHSPASELEESAGVSGSLLSALNASTAAAWALELMDTIETP